MSKKERQDLLKARKKIIELKSQLTKAHGFNMKWIKRRQNNAVITMLERIIKELRAENKRLEGEDNNAK